MGKGRGGAVGTKFRTTLGKFDWQSIFGKHVLRAMAMSQDQRAKGHLEEPTVECQKFV